jgi:hypothetical protein
VHEQQLQTNKTHDRQAALQEIDFDHLTSICVSKELGPMHSVSNEIALIKPKLLFAIVKMIQVETKTVTNSLFQSSGR